MWFVAELVMKIIVADDPRNVVHQNVVLVQANSADDAYEKALQVGKNGEASYENPAGKAVQITFEGLRNLDEMYEELGDGAELTFHYSVGVSEAQVQDLVKPKDRLGAFRPPERAEGPDYASAEVLALALQRLQR